MKKAKFRFLLLGLITLLVFPIPAYLLLNWQYQITFDDFIQLENIQLIPIVYGMQLGFVYALIILLVLQTPLFKSIPNNIPNIIKKLNLNWTDAIFISFCAGVGEELLFRVGLQHYLHWVPTSILFIAIHGYLNPWNLKYSLHGLILLPFIFIISYGYYFFGIWFCIGAHFMYDMIVFLSLINSNEKSVFS